MSLHSTINDRLLLVLTSMREKLCSGRLCKGTQHRAGISFISAFLLLQLTNSPTFDAWLVMNAHSHICYMHTYIHTYIHKHTREIRRVWKQNCDRNPRQKCLTIWLYKGTCIQTYISRILTSIKTRKKIYIHMYMYLYVYTIYTK